MPWHAVLYHRAHQLLGRYWGKQGAAAEWDRTLETKDMEKAKVLNVFFILVSTGKVWNKKDLPSSVLREHLNKLGRRKSMGPDGMHKEFT